MKPLKVLVLDDEPIASRVEAASLARTSRRPSVAAADPGMFTALRFLGLLDILSSMPAVPFVARLVSTPVCTASRRNTVRSAG